MEEKTFSIELMSKDSALAREFLQQVDHNSFNFLEKGWQNLTEMEIIDKACFSYHILSREMDAAETLARFNAIH